MQFLDRSTCQITSKEILIINFLKKYVFILPLKYGNIIRQRYEIMSNYHPVLLELQFFPGIINFTDMYGFSMVWNSILSIQVKEGFLLYNMYMKLESSLNILSRELTFTNLKHSHWEDTSLYNSLGLCFISNSI